MKATKERKQCRDCREWLPIEQFRVKKGKPLVKCIPCLRAYENKRYRRLNPYSKSLFMRLNKTDNKDIFNVMTKMKW